MTDDDRRTSAGGFLIVDDHEATLDRLQKLLARAYPGDVIRTAASAEEALALCSTAVPDLIIMDIGLPGQNGIEATRQIKALSPAVRVVMHSNHDHAVYREHCVKAGADA